MTVAGTTHGALGALFADPRPVDGLLFDPVEAERMQANVFERVFGAPDPVRIGRYTVLDRIGSGGMGVVYSAYDNRLDRKVAVKLVRRHHPRAQARMLSEAKAMARVSHPNVVQIHDAGEWQGQVFIAMELVVGTTLGEWVAETTRSVRDILDVLVSAGQGLAAAHEAGVVHRDFKPDNVLVGVDGRVRVLDFGIAQQEALAEESSTLSGDVEQRLTETGAVVGTPAYMAPEQFRHQEVDGRADQFAFGVVLFEALCGTRPFAGRDLEALSRAVCSGKRRALPRGVELPGEVRRTLDRALAPNPADRFASIGALIETLQPPRRVPRGLLVVLGVLLVVSLGLAWLYSRAAADRDDARDVGAAQAEVNARLETARQDADILRQARAHFASDPTMALATLRGLSPEAWTVDARGLATRAATIGVARSIIDGPPGHVSAEGGLFLALDGGSYSRIDPDTGARTRLERRTQPIPASHGRLLVWCCNEQRLELLWAETGTARSFVLPDDMSFYLVSDSGDALAIAGETTAQIYALPGGELRGQIAVPNRDPEASMALAPGGNAIAGVDLDGRIALWDADGVATGGEAFGYVRFSPGGRWLSARTLGRTLQVWPATRDGIREPPRERGEEVGLYAWSPTGDRLATMSDVHGLIIREVEGARLWPAEHSTDAPPTELAFSTDGRVLGGFGQGKLRLWDTETGVTTELRWPQPLVGWCTGKDGRIVTLDNEGTLAHWEVPWRGLRSTRAYDAQHEAVAVAYADDALIMGGADGVVKRWGAGDVPERWLKLDGPVRALDAHGTRVLALADETFVRVDDGERTEFPIEHTKPLSQLDAESDAATFGNSYSVQRIDFTTGEVVDVELRERIRGFEEAPGLIDRNMLMVKAFASDWWWHHASPSTIRAAVVSPDETWPMPRRPHLLSGESNGVLWIRTLDGEVRERASGFAKYRAVYRVLPSGRVLARTEDEGIALWAPGGTAPVRLVGSLYDVAWAGVTISPDEREVAIGQRSGRVVRIPVPEFWWGDDPGAVIDEYTDTVASNGGR